MGSDETGSEIRGRILVRAPDRVGDALLSTPALYSLRRGFPGHAVVAVAGAGVGRVYEGTDLVDRVVEYDVSSAERMFLRRYAFFRRLKDYHFDLAVLLDRTLDSAIMAYVSGARRRIGYELPGPGFFLTDTIPYGRREARTHRAELLMKLVEMIGAPRSELRPEFRVSEEERDGMSAALEELGLIGKRLIMLDAGSADSPRSWHPDRFAAALKPVCEETESHVLILRGTGDLDRQLAGFCSRMPGFPSIGERAALFEGSELVLCNAGTSMHLAAAVGAKIVAVFGPDVPEGSGPLSENDRLLSVTSRVACSPCKQRFFEECEPSKSGKPPCLEMLKPSSVVGALLDALS
jgi:heptosyltransferase-2